MKSNHGPTLRYAFRQSFPVMFGYLFMGFAFGLTLRQAGYSPIWAFLFGGLVYAGSLQFVAIGFLTQGLDLLAVALTSLFINSRHIFYGLSFLDRFRTMGRKKPYMIFSLTDETYSVLCAMEPPAGVDGDRAMFLVALFNQLYWVAGCTLGGLVGGLPLDFTGIEFSMTALFLVIFLGQWEASQNHLPALLGLGSGGLLLLILGPDQFLLPAICATVVTLLAARKQFESKAGKEEP